MGIKPTPKFIATLAAIGAVAASVSGCGQGYHLQGNHTWNTPAAAPRGAPGTYVSQSDAPHPGAGAGGGNTSFTR